ncbi:MAG: acetyl-CoA carboxylase biotin carboxyl carrier protein [Planctomycetes bacterium]|nr:acetyl-CoA carboxylase biotin carboxyl carrier protein [Planctomycetota bacterium]
MMVANDLVEVSLRDGEEEVNLRRPNHSDPVTSPTVTGMPMAQGAAAAPPLPAADAPPATSADEGELVEICSPMVGTFYTTPDPDSAPFVTVGQQVQAGVVVCILEAMKVFNEIKSEVTGTIERILVKNAEAVEFGQPLFLVRPL